MPQNDVYSKLGKPATPEGYGLKAEEGADPGFTDWAKNTFHKLNLTSEQGQNIVKEFGAFQAAQSAAEKEAHTTAVQQQTTNLKKEWGAAFQQNLNRAQAAFRRFGIPDKAVDSLEKSIGFDGVMKLMHKLGTSIGEHGYVGGDQNQSFGEGEILTPEQAKARIDSLKKDQEFTKKYLGGDVKAKAQMTRLHQMAYPTD
jgi:hypothetical protein